MWICKHCKQEFSDNTISKKSAHQRWCIDNPKREEHIRALSEKGKCEKNILHLKEMKEKAISLGYTNNFTKAAKLGLPEPEHYKHTEADKLKIKEASLKSKHRRLRRKQVIYKDVIMDSSWEVLLAKRLDFLHIAWIRPEPIEWIDKNKITHNYFPDFYLPEYDLYIDPKNEFAYKSQIEKIECLKTQLTNLVYLLSEDEINNYTPA